MASTDDKEGRSAVRWAADALFGVWAMGALIYYYHSMGFGQFLLGLFGD